MEAGVKGSRKKENGRREVSGRVADEVKARRREDLEVRDENGGKGRK